MVGAAAPSPAFGASAFPGLFPGAGGAGGATPLVRKPSVGRVGEVDGGRCVEGIGDGVQSVTDPSPLVSALCSHTVWYKAYSKSPDNNFLSLPLVAAATSILHCCSCFCRH